MVVEVWQSCSSRIQREQRCPVSHPWVTCMGFYYSQYDVRPSDESWEHTSRWSTIAYSVLDADVEYGCSDVSPHRLHSHTCFAKWMCLCSTLVDEVFLYHTSPFSSHLFRSTICDKRITYTMFSTEIVQMNVCISLGWHNISSGESFRCNEQLSTGVQCYCKQIMYRWRE